MSQQCCYVLRLGKLTLFFLNLILLKNKFKIAFGSSKR